MKRCLLTIAVLSLGSQLALADDCLHHAGLYRSFGKKWDVLQKRRDKMKEANDYAGLCDYYKKDYERLEDDIRKVLPLKKTSRCWTHVDEYWLEEYRASQIIGKAKKEEFCKLAIEVKVSGSANVIKGCEGLAPIYLRRAMKMSDDSKRLTDWMAKKDNAALCNYYSKEFPEWHTYYLGEIDKEKRKGVCWDNNDQKSLEKVEISVKEALNYQKEYCDNVTAK
jgi:hypothetical protein